MVALQLLKAFVVKINLKNKNMESGLYKKYIGSPCKKNGIDPSFDKDFKKLQAVNKTKDVDLGTVKSTLVDE